MFDPGLFLLVMVSLAIGFVAGVLNSRDKQKRQAAGNHPDKNFAGLNYLLDDPVDLSLPRSDLSRDAVGGAGETQLLLGRIFRQRGELDKAIQTHQELLARPSLNRFQVLEVQLELARDYLKAGLFDRAEVLLQDMLDHQFWPGWKDSLLALLSVYEMEKEWELAAVTVSRFRVKPGDSSCRLSHYYCELAETTMQRSDSIQARSLLRKAGLSFPSVRVSLLLGRLEYSSGRYKAAIRVLEKILHQDPDFIQESLPVLEQCYAALGTVRGLAAYLHRCLEKQPSVPLALAYARLLTAQHGRREADRFITAKVTSMPSLQGLGALLDLYLQEIESGSLPDRLVVLQSLVRRMEDAQALYCCRVCGFSGRTFLWHCPQCQTWENIRPVSSVGKRD
ncbi:MAG: hypothetical protein OXC07_09240 [Kistimonas sp.]|nr:hypothetical protein [Kistimonas sp.]